MAAKSKYGCQNVLELKKIIRKSAINKVEIETGDFVVLHLERYLSDPRHSSLVGETDVVSEPNLDVIQVTLGDKRNKMKAILAPSLNRLVQSNELHAGSTVSITGARLRYNEEDMSGVSLVIIESLTVTGVVEKAALDTYDQLTWCPGSSQKEETDVPLSSSRGYFVSLWSSMEMDGTVWETSVPSHNTLGLTPQDVYPIKELKKKYQVTKLGNPAALVRVMLKSRLRHYARPDKSDKWPFQAQLQVADSSGACTAVLWNAMCPKYYFSIKEGSILLLRNFRVKASYKVEPKFKQFLPDLDRYKIDLNLNSHHPVAEVKVIKPEAVPKELELPALTYTFVNRQQSGGLPRNYICDIVGVVTYVGSYEREHIKNKHGHDSGGFWVRRWLHLMDDSSSKPFVVQMYRLAEGYESQDIKPGCVLVCTHMRLVQQLDIINLSFTSKHTFLTSTAETQVTILDDASANELSNEPMVQQMWQWAQSRPGKQAVSHALVSGRPLPSSLMTITHRTPVLTSEDWEKVLTGLSYRQGRQLIVQATMGHVVLHVPGDLLNRSTSGKSPNKKRRIDSCGMTVDEHLDMNDHSITSLGSDQLDGDSCFPVVYTPDQWSVVKERLEFPATDITRQSRTDQDSEVELKKVQVPYFTITWLGLNTRIKLQTHLLCPHNIRETTNFTELLAGTDFPQNPLFTSGQCSLTDSQFQTVLLTARQCADKRFALVLDCYQRDSYNVDIYLNRGVALLPL